MPQSKRQKVSSHEPRAPHAPPSHSNYVEHVHATPTDTNRPSTAVSVAPTRPQLKPTDKLLVLDWHHAHGRNQKTTAAHFQRLPQYNKLNQGTISRWLTAEAKIREAAASASRPKDDSVQSSSRNAATREKRLKHPELEKCLTLWLDRLDTVQRARLTGREIKATARQIYDELEVSGADRLELSNGWLGRFQTRHGLKLHRRRSNSLVGSGEIDIEVERKRIQDDVRAFLDGHDSLGDVWSMETTTVLLDCSPIKVTYAGSDGGKRMRITVGLIANASGTERLEPIFVGCDNTHQTCLQYYFSNPMACMTSRNFFEWLHARNGKLVERNRHVLLLVRHPWGRLMDKMTFSNVQLRLIPASVMDHLSPFSIGLTKAFHTQFRKLVVQRALSKLRSSKDKIADGSTLFEMGDVDALELAKAAWQLADPGSKLAASCWRKTQILPAQANAVEASTTLIEADTSVNAGLAELDQALQALVLEASSRNLSLSCVSAAEFVHLGLQEAKNTDLSIKELVQLVVCQDDNHNDESLAAQDTTLLKEVQPPTSKQSDRLPSPPPNEVVLHAQLTLEQYWAQTHLSPAVLHFLQQSRSHLQHQTPPSRAPP